MKKNVFAIKVFLFLFLTGILNAQTTIPNEDWETYRDPTIVTATSFIGGPLDNAGWDNVFTFKNVPAENSAVWGSVAPYTNASGVIAWYRPAVVPSCQAAMEFQYFQTIIDVPANAVNISLTFNNVTSNDVARPFVFNSQYPNGGFISGQTGFWRTGSIPTIDLSAFVVPGEENRLVLVHADICQQFSIFEGLTVTYSWDVSATDDDDDGVPNDQDNCPNTANANQADSDGDGFGDACDDCPNDADNDADGDGVCGDVDICPGADDNADADGDGTPDACDACPNDFNNDSDGDGICDSDDACPNDADNDADGDGVCGDIDICPGGDDNADADGDGTPDFCDNCVGTPNADQADLDGDGIGDICDPCPEEPQEDNNGDGLPDCISCGNNKVLVCHRPAGNPENEQQLCLPLNALNAHLGNHGGCYIGVCNGYYGLQANEDGPDAIINHKREQVSLEEYPTYLFEVKPNPTTDWVTLHLHGHSENTMIYIHDQLGRLMLQQPVGVAESHFNIRLEDSRFANGLYFVSVVIDGERVVKRLMIAK